MKTVRHAFFPAHNLAISIRAAVEAILGLTRDIVKAVYAGSIQVLTRLACSVAAGNPAKIIKQYDSESKQWKRI